MPDVPKIRRFEEWYGDEFNPKGPALVHMLNDLAEHIERLEVNVKSILDALDAGKPIHVSSIAEGAWETDKPCPHGLETRSGCPVCREIPEKDNDV